jgi:signal transduction histidine kinase
MAALAAALGAALTVCAYLLPGFDVAYRSHELHTGVQAFGAAVALAAACVFLGRAGDGPCPAEQLIACALLVSAVANIGFLVVPTAHAYGHISSFSTWSSTLALPLAGSLFLAATLSGRRMVRRGRRTIVARTLAGVTVACAAIAVAVLLGARALPLAINASLSPVAGTALPSGSVAIGAVMLVSALLFAGAAWRMVTRPTPEGRLVEWLAVGQVAFSYAAANFAVFPSLYSDWVFVGDIAEFSGWLAVLVGVGAEVGLYRRQLVAGAVLEERRRMARDLHDGLAQELSFIALQVKEISGREGEQAALQRVAAACDRAILEARAAIAALTEPFEPDALGALRRTVLELASTYPDLDFDVVGAEIETSAAERDVLMRVAREAVTNAVRHGCPTAVRLRLAARTTRKLRVVDDGVGFRIAAQTNGFGLVSMRERAASVGGELVVSSVRGLGTAVELRLPLASGGTT